MILTLQIHRGPVVVDGWERLAANDQGDPVTPIIEKLAREAGALTDLERDLLALYGDEIEAFAQAVAKRCAEICRSGHDHQFGEAYRMAIGCAEDIEEAFGIKSAGEAQG